VTAIVIDTETTGIDEPEVIELAWTGPLRSLDPPDEAIERTRFRPSKPISIGAMAAHHIIEADLADCPLWPGSWIPPAGTTYLIGHNVDFDWKAIGSPDLPRICTLALSRSLWSDLDSHSLSALTYHFTEHHEARELLRKAHDAARDVELCCRVLVQVLKALAPRPLTWNQLWLASEKARCPERMTFGKLGPDGDWAKANGGKGMHCADVRRYDPGYYDWLFSKCDQVRDDPYLQKALRGEAA
jgi:exodeoxyribonuclease X